MTTAMAAYGTEHFRSHDNLRLMDETVAEVFGMMLGHETSIVAEQEDAMSERRTAIVGFSGALRGCCEVRMNSMAARTVTSAMLGAPMVDAEDPSIGDAVGEICNMIAGGWKNRVPALASACALSPPTIISGSDYVVKLGTPSIKFLRTYQFGGQTMQITMQCEELARA
ncbi:chemotaxis protein CheX [Granulicella pectinivorans]|jgi:chemotaxis protein CheX|uniref:Chemotaxis protein CheX n=1 Tax=Granulicella pectinivorans TaxID=474950 RepID=A0A1I6L2A8_9BACT|nr:chemotaxis protein CheX [Granulicella pectinivorans]SFR97586.1 chemotaxis protein CheX [Granulicella pectinivorans]